MLEKKAAASIAAQLEQNATDYIAECKTITATVCPGRGFYRGDKRNAYYKNFAKTLTNVADRSLFVLVSGLMAGLTSKSKQWFRLVSFDDDVSKKYNVQKFLNKLEKQIRLICDKSNIYEVLPLLYKESIAFGTSAAMMNDDYEDVIRLASFTAGQFFIDVDDRGVVNIFYRPFDLTVQGFINYFGFDNCPDKIKTDYQNNRLTTTYTVNQLIALNPKFVKGIDPDNNKFLSYYWMDGTNEEKEFIKVGGFDEFPMLIHRLETRTTHDAYGIGIGSTISSKIKETFKKIREKLKAIELAVRPPFTYTADIKNEINLMPGMGTKVPTGKETGIKTIYQVALDIEHLRKDIEDDKKEIASAFFADLFLMFQAGGNTATETNERVTERLGVLGTLTERFENELLEPLIKGIIAKIFKAGIISETEIPEELRGREIKIEYIGILSQAAKQIGLSNLRNAIALMKELTAVAENVTDNFDADNALRAACIDLGLDPTMLTAPEIMAERRKIKAQQEERRAQQEAMLAASRSAKDLGSAKITPETLLGGMKNNG